MKINKIFRIKYELFLLSIILKRRRWHAASFLINVRETCKTNQVTIDTIINDVVGLMSIHSEIVLVSKIMQLLIH